MKTKDGFARNPRLKAYTNTELAELFRKWERKWNVNGDKWAEKMCCAIGWELLVRNDAIEW